MSSGKRIELLHAASIAHRFCDLIASHVIKYEFAGSLRRQSKTVGDIEIVCVEKTTNPLSNVFVKGYKGMVVNGERLKRFKYPQKNGTTIQIELYIAQPHDYGRILAIRTGSSAFSHIKLATTWNRLGWCGTSEGLRRKKECDKKSSKWQLKEEYKDDPTLPPRFEAEIDFFNFLGISWIPPKERSWKSQHQKLNYSD